MCCNAGKPEEKSSIQYNAEPHTHTLRTQIWPGTQAIFDKENFLLTGLGGVSSAESYSPQQEHSRTKMSGEERSSSGRWDSGRTLLESEQFKVIVS